MILKKQLKKLKKTKTLENLHAESLKTVRFSEKEKIECDAKIEILKNKIIPLLPEYLKDAFERCFKNAESKDLAVETDRLLMSDGSSQTETDGRSVRETQTEEAVKKEESSQTCEKEIRETEVQTEERERRDSFTEIEKGLLAKSETESDSDCQTDPAIVCVAETQTDTSGNDKEIQTDEREQNLQNDSFPEKKLESLTKSLEEHANLLKECADFSEELTKSFSKEDVLAVRDETVQTETFRLPKWNQFPFPCGLTSLIPTRNLFSPMATLLTPLGRIFG